MQPALFLLVLESADDQIADDARHARHPLGQLLGGGDGQSGLPEEGGEQFRELLFAVGQCLDLAFGVQLGNANRQPFLAADEPAELQIVGQQPVWQAVAVTDELLAAGAFARAPSRRDSSPMSLVSTWPSGTPLRVIWKSGLPQAIRLGSFVAVIPLPADSSRAFRAGRWVCSVASPAACAFRIAATYLKEIHRPVSRLEAPAGKIPRGRAGKARGCSLEGCPLRSFPWRGIPDPPKLHHYRLARPLNLPPIPC